MLIIDPSKGKKINFGYSIEGSSDVQGKVIAELRIELQKGIYLTIEGSTDKNHANFFVPPLEKFALLKTGKSYESKIYAILDDIVYEVWKEKIFIDKKVEVEVKLHG